MGIKHAITRKTFEVTIDGAMKYINKDRETNLLKLVDMAQKIMGEDNRISNSEQSCLFRKIGQPTLYYKIFQGQAHRRASAGRMGYRREHT